MTDKARSEPYEHPSLSREEFKKLFLDSEVYAEIQERIISQAYSHVRLVSVINRPGAELVQTLIGIRGESPDTTQFFHFSVLIGDSADETAD